MKKEGEQEERWPELSLKERDRRWNRVKDLMRANGLECLVVFGLRGREWFDRYLTNDRAGGTTIFPLEGEMVHLEWAPFDMAAHMESALRGEASWVNDVRLRANGPSVVEVLKEKGYERAIIGIVGLTIFAPGEVEGYVPYTTWTYILNNLPGTTFKEVSDDFAQLVSVKSDEELQLVRRGAEIGELAAEAMIKASRPGAMENEIYAAVMNQIFLNGANGSQAPYITPLILQTGPDNTGWGAPMWMLRGGRPRIVQKGDLVMAEIFSRYGCMETQTQMCVALEPVNPIIKECAKIARSSYEAGLKALRPGKAFGEVVEAMEEPTRQSGAWHSTPHIHSLNPFYCIGEMGVGLEKIPGFDKYKGDFKTPTLHGDLVIQAGTVWALEPSAGLGKHKAFLGGTVVATNEGAVELNKVSTEMRVVG